MSLFLHNLWRSRVWDCGNLQEWFYLQYACWLRINLTGRKDKEILSWHQSFHDTLSGDMNGCSLKDSQGSRNPQTPVVSQRTPYLCHNDAHFGCWPLHREQTIRASQSNHNTDLRQHRWLRLPLSRLGKVWINSASPLAAPSVDKKKREAVDMIPDFMQ